jgi:hypothetical protein
MLSTTTASAIGLINGSSNGKVNLWLTSVEFNELSWFFAIQDGGLRPIGTKCYKQWLKCNEQCPQTWWSGFWAKQIKYCENMLTRTEVTTISIFQNRNVRNLEFQNFGTDQTVNQEVHENSIQHFEIYQKSL